MSYSYLSYKFVTSVNMYSFVYFFDAAIQPSSCVQLKRLPEEIANNECGDDEMSVKVGSPDVQMMCILAQGNLNNLDWKSSQRRSVEPQFGVV